MYRLLRERGFRALLWLALTETVMVAACVAGGQILSGQLLSGQLLSGQLFHSADWTIEQRGPEILLFSLTVTACACACGLYSWRHMWSYADTAVRIVVSLGLAVAALSTATFLFPGLSISRSGLAVGVPLALLTLMLTRRVLQVLVERGMMRRRILVIGAGENARRLLEVEGSARGLRFTFVGFVDVRNEERRVDDRVIPVPNSVHQLARSLDAQEVVLAAGERRGSLPLRSLIRCRLSGIAVSEYQVFCERELGRIDHNALRPDWFLSDGFASGPVRTRLKRALDIVGAALLLFATWPLLLATAVAVAIESPGGVFYRQERIGLHGRTFRLTKFRSMYADAEKDGVPRWAAAGDDRVTAIGRIIRTIRIDEIPQALNVMRGEMSLVGPRPERPFFVDQIGGAVPFYAERHYVKPGITGWAQINYPYGASLVDAKRKLEYDLFYIKYFSLVLDLLIILQTLRIILWREGVR